ATRPMLLDFVTLDVFTVRRYTGNPLAIVSVPSADALTREQKQAIAKEFDLSETVFMYPPSNEGVVPINIYTPRREVPFAGHPVVGSTYFLLGIGPLKRRKNAVLETLSGLTPITYDPSTSQAAVSVAHDVLIHKPYELGELSGKILGLLDADVVQLPGGGIAVASIVKGMTFLMIQVKDTEALGRIRGASQDIIIEGKGDRAGEKDWLGTYILVYCFVITEEKAENGVSVKKVRSRMFFSVGKEDPATGSAASTFSAWMSLTVAPSGEKEQRYEITQGVEIGRRSEIGVTVRKGENGIEKVLLHGQAVEVTEGRIKI
ncbi:Diaminopimelate epimerase-like protein, partial [Neolentinus lepideus HHB14362 ss-1]